MDQSGKPSSLNSRNPQRPRSASASDLIQNHAARGHTDGSRVSAQDASAFMLSQGYYPSMAPVPGSYGNFLHHDNMTPFQSFSPTSVNFHGHTVAAQTGSESSTNQHNVPQASSSLNLHSGPPPYLDPPHDSLHLSDAISNPTRGQQMQVSAVASNRNSSSAEAELTEAERAAASDEKRRRNTAASARFRVKKKRRTISLERAVSELTGRAEELEREVGDLRRENGWLKEIVVLKGGQNIANNRLALRQAVASGGQWSYGIESTVQEDVSEVPSSDDDIPAKQFKGKQRSNKKS